MKSKKFCSHFRGIIYGSYLALTHVKWQFVLLTYLSNERNEGILAEELNKYLISLLLIWFLQAELCRRLELRDLLWDCGWGDRHFRGCLQSFQVT